MEEQSKYAFIEYLYVDSAGGISSISPDDDVLDAQEASLQDKL